MEQVVVYLALVLVGATLGSFAGATVWRIRARQLSFDKENKEPYDKKEFQRLKKLLGKKTLEDRSRCLECGYALKWYDLIPIVSWLSLRGRCRSCKHPIGKFELLMELGIAFFFVASYFFWPAVLDNAYGIAYFGLWLAAGVTMAILFAYDAKWFLLPNKLTLILALIGAGMVAIMMIKTQDYLGVGVSALAAVAILAGLYGLLYYVSGGRWVGFGDVKLGVGLGLILGDWELAAVALFLANLIGCIIVIPLLATKKLERNAHIPFGPLLIAGTVVTMLFGWQVLNWYLGLAGL